VIEHNVSVIKNADWIIDTGPDGGHRGGNIMFEGIPKDLLEAGQSITAVYMKSSLHS
jgi:excinuclease UvrABC ATPase subunit